MGSMFPHTLTMPARKLSADVRERMKKLRDAQGLSGCRGVLWGEELCSNSKMTIGELIDAWKVALEKGEAQPGWALDTLIVMGQSLTEPVRRRMIEDLLTEDEVESYVRQVKFNLHPREKRAIKDRFGAHVVRDPLARRKLNDD